MGAGSGSQSQSETGAGSGEEEASSAGGEGASAGVAGASEEKRCWAGAEISGAAGSSAVGSGAAGGSSSVAGSSSSAQSSHRGSSTGAGAAPLPAAGASVVDAPCRAVRGRLLVLDRRRRVRDRGVAAPAEVVVPVQIRVGRVGDARAACARGDRRRARVARPQPAPRRAAAGAPAPRRVARRPLLAGVRAYATATAAPEAGDDDEADGKKAGECEGDFHIAPTWCQRRGSEPRRDR